VRLRKAWYGSAVPWSTCKRPRGSLAVLTPALMAALACGETVESPTAPGSENALAITTSAALAFRQVSAGDAHTCGVTTDDRAYCWGINDFGQLGDGTTTERLRPVPVAGGHRFRQVSATVLSTCGVTTTNRLYCWGDLGGKTPVLRFGGLRFRHVSVNRYQGGNHCGVTTEDRAYCWGSNFYGQLGDGTTTSRNTPVPVAGTLRFREVNVGYFSACGVTTTDVAYCWGLNSDGQLGDGTTTNRKTPRRVAGGLRFRQVSMGDYKACGVTTSNLAYCWGNGLLGQLGDGLGESHLTPFPVVGGLSFRRVNAGGAHTCGVTTTNQAYCWGWNFFGQLGDGTRTGDGSGSWHRAPVAVAGGLSFQSVVVGAVHTCGRTTPAVAYCWGLNRNGQLGVGGRTLRLAPTAVLGPN
jgi:alpha-tubulin suppressor-like RCC1 family protein